MILNLGCGTNKNPDGIKCVNIDSRKEANPDKVADIKNLPFNNVDGIIAIDVLEHISRSLVKKTLKHWFSILKKDGYLLLRLPNVRKICKRFLSENLDCKEFSRLIYGNQEGNKFEMYHKSGFDKKRLTRILRDVGFKIVENDIDIFCTKNNMVIKAEKPK